jgi:Flp pilus assembly pilin Flp
MRKLLKKFTKSETGAVSTDWVVLTAVVVGLTGASAMLINDGIVSASSKIGESVDTQPISVVN